MFLVLSTITEAPGNPQWCTQCYKCLKTEHGFKEKHSRQLSKISGEVNVVVQSYSKYMYRQYIKTKIRKLVLINIIG